MFTNWVKYRVESRGSNGTWEYIYSPYICSCGDDKQSIVEELCEYESWARHADYVRFHWEIHVWPPIQKIHDRIIITTAEIESLQERLSILEKQFNILSEIE